MTVAASRLGNGSGICHAGDLAARLPNELVRAVVARLLGRKP
jgi:hypothetical protein